MYHDFINFKVSLYYLIPQLVMNGRNMRFYKVEAKHVYVT